jgi:hypothetical protein
MKSTILSLIAALATQQVAGHSIFQDLWVNGVDEISIPLKLHALSTNALLPEQLCPNATIELAGCRRH